MSDNIGGQDSAVVNQGAIVSAIPGGNTLTSPNMTELGGGDTPMSICPKNALNSLWGTALTVGRWFSFLSAV